MDWASFIFGAFMSCVLASGGVAAALAFVTRREYFAWMAARAVALGLWVLTFPPAGAWLFTSTDALWTARFAATDLAVAVIGPLLATYLEPRIKAPRLRRLLWAMLPAGLLLGAASPAMVLTPSLYWFHNLVLLGLVLTLVAALAVAIRLGSLNARFQAAAWGPSIAIGFVAFYHELVLLRSLPFYAEAMLAAVLFEFVMTTVGIGHMTMLLSRRLDAAVAHVHEATLASGLDPLTGIANRRGLAARFADPDIGRPFGLAVIDCDHFKRVNDNFGHDKGDEVLVAVAEALKGEDIYVGRLGGEEFVVLVYRHDWQALAEQARERIALGVRLRTPQLAFRVTASAGLARVLDNDTLESAIKRADRALYAAKDAGRDRSLLIDELEGADPRIVHLA